MLAAETEVVSGKVEMSIMPRRTMPILRRMEAGDFVPARFFPVVEEVRGRRELLLKCWDREEFVRIILLFRPPSLVRVSMDLCIPPEEEGLGEDSRVES